MPLIYTQQQEQLDNLEEDYCVEPKYRIGEIVLGIMRHFPVKEIVNLKKVYGGKIPDKTWIKYHHQFNRNIMRYARVSDDNLNMYIVDGKAFGYVRNITKDKFKFPKYHVRWESRDPEMPMSNNEYECSEETIITTHNLELIEQENVVAECERLFALSQNKNSGQ